MGLVPTEEEKRAFMMYKDAQEIYKERIELLQIIKNLVITQPNDQELGKELRKLFSTDK